MISKNLQKNMCIMITEDAKKKDYVDLAKKAGLKEEEWQPMANMIWKMKLAKSMEQRKMIWLGNCGMLKPDGSMLHLDEELMPETEWTSMDGKDLTWKMQFWWEKWEKTDCKISKVKAMVSTSKDYRRSFIDTRAEN